MTKFHDKIMVVLFWGTIWGAFEVFGYRWLTLLSVPHKSPFLFAFAMMAMVAARRTAPFPGSALLMASLAGFYKVLTLSLPACGSNAVIALILDAAAFEIVCAVAKDIFNLGFPKRAALSVLMVILAYSSFAAYATYINPEGTAASRTFNSVLTYLINSGSQAALLSIFTFHLGLALGNSLRKLFSQPDYRRRAGISRTFAAVLTLGLWMARLIK